MRHRALYSLIYDVAIAFLAYLLAVLLLAGGGGLPVSAAGLLRGAGTFTLAAGLCFQLTGLHKGVWRYASLSDLGLIMRAATGTVAIFVAVTLLSSGPSGFPWPLPVIAWLALTAMLAASRVVYRALKDRDGRQAGGSPREEREPVLLMGTGAAADLFIRGTLARRSCPYRVVGIIDEKGRRVGRCIHGARILGTLDDLEDVVARLDERGERPLRLVLMAGTKHLEARTALGLAERAEKLELRIFRLPDIAELNDGASSVTELRAVRIEDLLGRPRRF